MLTQAEDVPHLFLLGTQVSQRMRSRHGFARKSLHDLDTGIRAGCMRLLGAGYPTEGEPG